MKTIIHSGPGPVFKGVVRVATGRLFETEWLPAREAAEAQCEQFKATSQAPEITDQTTRQSNWDF